MIYLILFGAEVLKGFFGRSNLPAALATLAAGSGLDPWLVLLLMLAALIVLGCFMDSLASLEIPAIGYGIRYEFGIFDQTIQDGWQVEITDKWLRFGNPWEIPRPEIAYQVGFGGHTEAFTDERGGHRVRWIPHSVVQGVAYDTPILGYAVNTCNRLRLWKAEAVESFDFACFNRGGTAVSLSP